MGITAPSPHVGIGVRQETICTIAFCVPYEVGAAARKNPSSSDLSGFVGRNV